MPAWLKKLFWFINRFLMVPLFRLGFGALMGNPFTGYIMVLKVTGRKTGKTRYAPVNFAIQNGKIYCISGGRRSSDWFANLLNQPQLEVILPSGAVFGSAHEVQDEQERLVIIRKVLVNAGFAGFFEGYNPLTISDEALKQKITDLPLVCIQPEGAGSGAFEPGGWAWVWVLLGSAALVWLVLRQA